jgi:hypothetical protein
MKKIIWIQEEKPHVKNLGSLRPIAKRSAKAGKIHRKAAREGIKVKIIPSIGYASAGLRHDAWQWRD